MIPFVILLILAIGILECITLYDPLKDADYSVRTLKRSVEEGEVFSVESTVTNHSPLPMAFLGLEESFPGEASFPNLPAQYTLHLPPDSLKLPKKLFSTVFLMPRQTLTRRVELSLPARGRYFLRGGGAHRGRFSGLSEQEPELVCLPGDRGTARQIPGKARHHRIGGLPGGDFRAPVHSGRSGADGGLPGVYRS